MFFFIFLTANIPVVVMGRGLEPVPAAHGQRADQPLDDSPADCRALCEQLEVDALLKGTPALLWGWCCTSPTRTPSMICPHQVVNWDPAASQPSPQRTVIELFLSIFCSLYTLLKSHFATFMFQINYIPKTFLTSWFVDLLICSCHQDALMITLVCSSLVEKWSGFWKDQPWSAKMGKNEVAETNKKHSCCKL